MSRLQLALNVSDLDEAIEFYSKLFGAEPAKRRPGYANFAIAEPPLKLVLIEDASARGSGVAGALNHRGVEVASPDEVVQATRRLSAEGLATELEEETRQKDETVKRELFEAYRDVNSDFIFWMEQMREKPLRHPAYQVEGDDPKAQWELAKNGMSRAWTTAPVLIVILGDDRRQWGTVQGALTFGRHQSHLTD